MPQWSKRIVVHTKYVLGGVILKTIFTKKNMLLFVETQYLYKNICNTDGKTIP